LKWRCRFRRERPATLQPPGKKGLTSLIARKGAAVPRAAPYSLN